MEFGKEYLKLFDTEKQYNEFRVSNEFLLPNVSYILENRKKIYNKRARNQYLSFLALEDGTFKFSGNSISYSLDSGSTWTNIASDTSTPTVESGHTIIWKASGLTPTTDIGIGTFSSTGNFTVEGNVMSLCYGDDFVGQTDLTEKDYAFRKLFSDCIGMTSAINLSLPATTLASDCYRGMFQNCTSLTTVPSDLLPATTLASNCYRGMFSGCTSLTTVPSDLLPATTLASDCYRGMFQNCTSLTTVPDLPATTLASDCYRYMFYSCTSLTTVPSDLLPATTLAANCYRLMFQNCTSLTTVPELPATTLAESCYHQMFNNCSLTTVPSDLLPATTLASDCYRYMFLGCTGLTTAPVLSATTLAEGCYSNMFGRCTSLNSITCLATDISASNCTTNWVNNVAANGTFTKAASMTSWTEGVNGIPSGWAVVDAT